MIACRWNIHHYLVLLVFLILISCTHEPVTHDVSELDIQRVVLITVDTLRADHLGSYGYPRETSPFLDSLARTSFVFENHFASMPTTVPSHASLFTSLHPLQLNILKNGHLLDSSYTTLAEDLQTGGFHTAGVVATNGHFIAANLDQGFNLLVEPETASIFDGGDYQNASDTVDVAVDWLKKAQSETPFFLWIHLFDPHKPLKPHPELESRLAEQSEPKNIIPFWQNVMNVSKSFFRSPDEMFEQINRYDAEILYTDTQIERFYQVYEQMGLLDNTLFIITADHGEGVGNHRWWGHGKYIYNEQLRIPLIMHFPGLTDARGRIQMLCENIDIYPTLAELLNVTVTNPDDQYGKSLVSLMFSGYEESFHKKTAFSQRRVYDSDPPQPFNSLYSNYDFGEKTTLQTLNMKYIYRTEGKDEVYLLDNDPCEMKNVYDPDDLIQKKMKTEILNRIQELSDWSDLEPQSVEEEFIDKLKALGYVQ